MEKQWRKSGCLKSSRDVTWRKKNIFNVSFLHDGRAGSPLQRTSCSRETCSPDLGQKAGYQATGPAISPCAPPRRTHTSMVKLLLFCWVLLITPLSGARLSVAATASEKDAELPGAHNQTEWLRGTHGSGALTIFIKWGGWCSEWWWVGGVEGMGVGEKILHSDLKISLDETDRDKFQRLGLERIPRPVFR